MPVLNQSSFQPTFRLIYRPIISKAVASDQSAHARAAPTPRSMARMDQLTAKLWAGQNKHEGDRLRLFTAVANAVSASDVLYPARSLTSHRRLCLTG